MIFTGQMAFLSASGQLQFRAQKRQVEKYISEAFTGTCMRGTCGHLYICVHVFVCTCRCWMDWDASSLSSCTRWTFSQVQIQKRWKATEILVL